MLERNEKRRTLEDLFWDWTKTFDSEAFEYYCYLKRKKSWEKGSRAKPAPVEVPEKVPFPKFSTFKHHFYTKIGVRFGRNIKCQCDDCTALKNLTRRFEEEKNDFMAQQARKALKAHQDRSEFKTEIVHNNMVNSQLSFSNSPLEKKSQLFSIDEEITAVTTPACQVAVRYKDLCKTKIPALRKELNAHGVSFSSKNENVLRNLLGRHYELEHAWEKPIYKKKRKRRTH